MSPHQWGTADSQRCFFHNRLDFRKRKPSHRGPSEETPTNWRSEKCYLVSYFASKPTRSRLPSLGNRGGVRKGSAAGRGRDPRAGGGASGGGALPTGSRSSSPSCSLGGYCPARWRRRCGLREPRGAGLGPQGAAAGAARSPAGRDDRGGGSPGC